MTKAYLLIVINFLRTYNCLPQTPFFQINSLILAWIRFRKICSHRVRLKNIILEFLSHSACNNFTTMHLVVGDAGYRMIGWEWWRRGGQAFCVRRGRGLGARLRKRVRGFAIQCELRQRVCIWMTSETQLHAWALGAPCTRNLPFLLDFRYRRRQVVPPPGRSLYSKTVQCAKLQQIHHRRRP